MKKRLLLILLFGIFLFSLSSRTIDQNTAQAVANFHLQVRGVQNSFSIQSMNTLSGKGGTLAYIANLNPVGFIAVSANTNIVPIVAYSFKSNYYPDTDPKNILYFMLKKDLEMRIDAMNAGILETAVNNELWNNYQNQNSSYFASLSFQKWPDKPTLKTDGWVSTTWSQLAPFNQYCPIDPTTGKRSSVGCAALALAQIVHYTHYLGNASFATSDVYTTLNGIDIDADSQTADFPNFTTLNNKLKTIDQKFKNSSPLNPTDIAALCFASGIAVNMHYSSIGADSWTWNIGHAFRNKFNYRQAKGYDMENEEFFEHLQTNAKQRYPVNLIVNDYYEHSMICDGYNNAGEYHLNFGWAKDDPGNYTLAWYHLPTFRNADYNIISQAVMYIGKGVESVSVATVTEKIELEENDSSIDLFEEDIEETENTEQTKNDAIQESINDKLEGDDLPTVGTTSKFTIYEEPPVAVKQVPPVYPRFLKESGISGTVFLQVEVLDNGKVGAVEVLKSLMPGEGGLDEAAIKAVKQWEFSPAQSGGKPVACWVTFPISFSLE